MSCFVGWKRENRPGGNPKEQNGYKGHQQWIRPRNFVTYSVNEVVRPAGNITCGRCGGSGKLNEE
ncbi:MAG: hypothetical protein IPP38_10030 [Bacteroidetes bacterium]|nr:hypothetical protein [Bacteroidota bacterium]